MTWWHPDRFTEAWAMEKRESYERALGDADPRLLPIRERYERAWSLGGTFEHEGYFQGRPVEEVWTGGGQAFLELLAFLESQEAKATRCSCRGPQQYRDCRPPHHASTCPVELALSEEERWPWREPSPEEAYQDAMEAAERSIGSKATRALERAILARLALLGWKAV